MRTTGIVVVACAAVLSGCASTPSSRELMDAFVEAAYERNREELARPATPLPTPTVLDPVTAELLTAAYLCFEEQRRIAVANVANVHSVGYKRRIAEISMDSVDLGDGEVYQLPHVERVGSVFTTGTLEITERSLDVAVDGSGFFSFLRYDGSIGYTRDGNLHIDAEGRLVISDGRVILPQITVPSDLLEISIDPLGAVSGRTAGSPDAQTIFGQIDLHRFLDPNGLLLDGSTYCVTDASGRPISGKPGNDGLGVLKQGFLERSNVQVATELMNLQCINRQQEMLTRVLERFGMVAP